MELSGSRGLQMMITKLMDEGQYIHFQVVQQELATKGKQELSYKLPSGPIKKGYN